jgi:hypothetical protein
MEKARQKMKKKEEKGRGKLIGRCLVTVLLVAVVHDDIRWWKEKRKVRLVAEMRGGGRFFFIDFGPKSIRPQTMKIKSIYKE